MFQLIILLLLITDFAMLWSGKMSVLIRLSAVQGVFLAGLILLPPEASTDLEHIALAMAVLVLKGVGFPLFLWRTFHRLDHSSSDTGAEHKRGATLPVLAGLGCLAFALLLEGRIAAVQGLFPPMLMPVALTTLFCGLIVVVCSVSALTQVIGYLVLENGIFILGIPLMTAGTVWFELSILLDVFAAIFVMAIAITHINSAFDSTDLERFSSLRD